MVFSPMQRSHIESHLNGRITTTMEPGMHFIFRGNPQNTECEERGGFSENTFFNLLCRFLIQSYQLNNVHIVQCYRVHFHWVDTTNRLTQTTETLACDH